jgi:hypothetical protein
MVANSGIIVLVGWLGLEAIVTEEGRLVRNLNHRKM